MKFFVVSIQKIYACTLQFEEAASKDDLLGASETSIRGFFSKSSLKQKNTVFTIGNRGDILTSQLDAPVIIPHSAHQKEARVRWT